MHIDPLRLYLLGHHFAAAFLDLAYIPAFSVSTEMTRLAVRQELPAFCCVIQTEHSVQCSLPSQPSVGLRLSFSLCRQSPTTGLLMSVPPFLFTSVRNFRMLSERPQSPSHRNHNSASRGSSNDLRSEKEIGSSVIFDYRSATPRRRTPRHSPT